MKDQQCFAFCRGTLEKGESLQLLSRLGLLQNGGLPLGGQGVVDAAQLGDGLKTNVADDLFVDSSSKELVET